MDGIILITSWAIDGIILLSVCAVAEIENVLATLGGDPIYHIYILLFK